MAKVTGPGRMSALIRSEDPVELSDDRCAELFLDYFNNYLSVEKFAEHHGWWPDEAKAVIERGRSIHEARVKRG